MILPSGKSGTLSSSARITNDLIAHIDFSNDYGWAGNTANDLANRSVQYSAPGGYISVVSGSTAEPGYIDLDGSTDYLFAGKTLDAFLTATAITIDAWVKPDTVVLGTIASNGSNTASAPNRGFNVIFFPDGLGYLGTRALVNSGSSLSIYAFPGLTASTGEWTNVFITLRHDAGSVYYSAKLFKPNGLSASDFTGASSFSTGFTSSNYLAVGRRSTAALQYWNGMIGAVKVYNRVLSETEMNLNYERSKKRYGHS
jgi:hypothetical protein